MKRKNIPILALAIAVIIIVSGCSGQQQTQNTQTESAAPAIAISGFAFAPQTLTVKAGTTITWTNKDSASHTVVSDDKTVNSETLAKGDSFEFKFDKSGTYTYICGIHPSMKGIIVVE